jgi:xylulokinase
MPCEPLNSITKVAWLVRNCADIARSVWKFVHYEDFLLMKIAGIPALDFTMASRTMAFDPVRKDWLPDLLEFAGIRPSQLGNVCPSGVPVGIVLHSIAERWGVNADALVVAGGHDQCVAAIGAGVIESDLACYSMGTAEVIGTCFPQFRTSAATLASNYPCYCHSVPDHYFTITLNQSGGLSLEWFYRTVLGEETGDQAYQQFLAHAETKIRFTPSPVLFLPHVVGSGTPTCDHMSRASFLGMSLGTTRDDLFQSVLDALCFEAKLNLETLDTLGISVTELRAVGGGAQSRQILRLKASVLNRPISTLRVSEAGLLGAAILAQVATGVYSNLADAVGECVTLRSTVDPDPGVARAYEEAFGRYRQLYGTLRNFYHHWRDSCETPVVA